MYKKYRYLDTDIHIYNGDNLTLLQHDKPYPLSWLRDGDKRPSCVVNCSYFTNEYVLGRNQGDLFNNTHDQEGFIDLVFTDTYHLGSFKSWDYTNSKCGLSVATVLIKNGKDTQEYSSAICNESKFTTRNPQTAIAIQKDGSKLLIVSDGRSKRNRGLNGYELREFMKLHYSLALLCQLDGGGSSEMIVDGAIVNEPSDGRERPMWNGLAFTTQEVYEPLMSPFKKMCITQFDHNDYSHKGSNAWDITNGVPGDKAPYFAPCELKCMAIDNKFAFTWWQSTYKHKLADGSNDYITAMFGHDDVINAKVGQVVSKGTQIGNMGTGGNAQGVHCHIEVAKGLFKEKWIPNKYGVYVLPNSSLFNDIFYMDDTEIIKYANPNDERFERLNKIEFKYVKPDIVSTLTKQLVEANKTIEQKDIEIVKLENKLKKIGGILNED